MFSEQGLTFDRPIISVDELVQEIRRRAAK
jgi:hypothetical protein